MNHSLNIVKVFTKFNSPIWAKINPGILAQIAGHKPSALVDKHYTVRPMDMLREALQVYEDWILENAKQKK